jgi:hypothetical protein
MNPIALWPLGGDRRQQRRRRRKFSTPDVDKKQRGDVATREAPDVDKKQRGDVATREVEEHNKYFSALYARVFSTLAAKEKLTADEKSKGFLAPNTDEKSGEHTMSTRSDADKKSGFSMTSSRRLTLTRSDVDKGHFSTLNADEGFEFPTTGRTGDERHFLTLNAGKKSKFSTPDVDKRHFSTLNADSRRGVQLKGPFDRGRKLTYLELSMLNANGRSGFSTPRNQGSPFDRGRTSRQRGRLRTTRRLNCRCKALYARVFSTLAANERLAADEKSKGFWAPNAGEKSGDHTMPTTTDERLYQMGASYSSTAERTIT